eukprot:SAG22_NODE_1198_length_5193_cov_12.289360_6_plen_66_part_00
MKPSSRLARGTTVLYSTGPGAELVEGEVWATNYLVWTVRHLDGSGDVVGMLATEIRAAVSAAVQL